MLADFASVVGNNAIVVPTISTGDDPFVLPGFQTEGRRRDHEAVLVYSVRRVLRDTEVHVNNSRAGAITRAVDPDLYRTQMIVFPGSYLWGNSSQNKIVLRAVGERFEIKDMVCFFHQDD
ncbi:hypothetical protein [Actinomycetospora aeridis]|uniref:Uncharacterized protein n=1 Tax=Actinomycetospora aeridis TaxID=3129231 RepID=A0ABU8NBW5_9PSEU